MQRLTYLLSLLFVLATSIVVSAQGTASSENTSINLTTSDISFADGENWTFYLDVESKVYYIDFETISVNLNDIMVKNMNGDVVKKDNLWDLPVNTIYELDLKDLKPGEYEIELRTYTGVIKKEVTVAE